MKQYRFTSSDFVDTGEVSDDCFLDPSDPYHPNNLKTTDTARVTYTKPGVEEIYQRTLPKDR